MEVSMKKSEKSKILVFLKHHWNSNKQFPVQNSKARRLSIKWRKEISPSWSPDWTASLVGFPSKQTWAKDRKDRGRQLCIHHSHSLPEGLPTSNSIHSPTLTEHLLYARSCADAEGQGRDVAGSALQKLKVWWDYTKWSECSPREVWGAPGDT